MTFVIREIFLNSLDSYCADWQQVNNQRYGYNSLPFQMLSCFLDPKHIKPSVTLLYEFKI